MRGACLMVIAAAVCGCGESKSQPASDATATVVDAPAAIDAAVLSDGPVADELAAARQRLFTDYAAGADTCATWAALDASQRSVFLTLSHRLFISNTPDGSSMLQHMTELHLILGGGADGKDCGGSENNRLFLSMDAYLWQLMVDTWNDTNTVGDGGSGVWKHTGDLAGPHDPFNASNETETGLRCVVLIELPESKPPTAQSHFFLAGDEVAVQRGPGIDLPADQYMFEIDHDFNCTHQSNPLCPGTSFEPKYVQHYGDYSAGWMPSGCAR